MNPVDLLNLITEELNSSGFLVVNRNHLNGVALDSEVTPGEFDVIALVLDGHQATNQLVSINALPNLER